MAKRRKRKSGGEQLVGALLIAAVVAIALAIGLALILSALLADAAFYAFDRYRGRPRRGVRLTRALLFRIRHRRAPVRVESFGQLLSLTPTGFEEAVAQSLRDRGYSSVRRCGGPGDLGVDITCVDPNGEKIAIQCKRYMPGNRVGSRDIQLFIGMTHTEHNVDLGVFVTTSSFTNPARALAKRHGIRLIDSRNLTEILNLEPLEQQPQPATLPAPPEAPKLTVVPTPPVAVECFFLMSEEELVEIEAIVVASHEELPAEIVRPLVRGGRLGMRFASIADMATTAAGIEAAAQALALQSPMPYRRDAMVGALVAALRNGGQRSFELPQRLSTAETASLRAQGPIGA